MSNGGILYASDFALDVVVAMFPEHIQSTIETGDGDQPVTATVTSTNLQAFTGKGTATLQYDLDGWKTVDAISATPEVLLRGTFTGEGQTYANKPLAIVIPHGQGQVIFTSFHNEASVTADQLAVLRYFIYLQ